MMELVDSLDGWRKPDELVTSEADSVENGDKDEEFYTVEKIVNKYVMNDVSYYFVKFVGYGNEDNQWIPEADCRCPDLIKEYEGSLVVLEPSSPENSEDSDPDYVPSPQRRWAVQRPLRSKRLRRPAEASCAQVAVDAQMADRDAQIVDVAQAVGDDAQAISDAQLVLDDVQCSEGDVAQPGDEEMHSVGSDGDEPGQMEGTSAEESLPSSSGMMKINLVVKKSKGKTVARTVSILYDYFLLLRQLHLHPHDCPIEGCNAVYPNRRSHVIRHLLREHSSQGIEEKYLLAKTYGIQKIDHLFTLGSIGG